MSVVRRAVAGAAVVGVVLAGGPAWAAMEQPDYAPEIAEGGLVPEDPCFGSQPVEPGDGVVTDGDTPVSSDGSTASPVQGDPPADGGGSEPSDPGMVEPDQKPAAEPVQEPGEAPGEAPRPGEAPAPLELVDPVPTDDDGIVCAYADPISAPVLEGGAVQDGAGQGPAVRDTATTGAATTLPRTGTDRTTAVLALATGLLVGGAGATALSRRRPRRT